MNNFITNSSIKARILLTNFLSKGSKVLKNKGGISSSVEHMLWVIAGAVIVVIILTVMIAFINDDFMPSIKEKLTEILNLV